MGEPISRREFMICTAAAGAEVVEGAGYFLSKIMYGEDRLARPLLAG